MTNLYSFNNDNPRFTAHTALVTAWQDWRQANCPRFIDNNEWTPNSPDLNQLDYRTWGWKSTANFSWWLIRLTSWKSPTDHLGRAATRTHHNKAVANFTKCLTASVAISNGHLEHLQQPFPSSSLYPYLITNKPVLSRIIYRLSGRQRSERWGMGCLG